MHNNRTKLLGQLAQECNYVLDNGIMCEFLDSMKPQEFHAREPVIEAGKRNSNIYILADGILRMVYFEGDKERTAAFGLPGTMSISQHSYYMNLPAFIQIEACCESTVLCSSKQNFDYFINKYKEFLLWALHMAQCQLFFFETKLKVINGDAKERLLSLYRHRPEIIEKVPQNIIASYLNITPAYLCRLKKNLGY